jgi:hypothetical protein
MAVFTPGVSTAVEGKAPDAVLKVAVAPTNPLKVGKHVFQLVVTDDSGNQSTAAAVTVIVVDKERPTAVIDFIDAAGARHPEPQVTIPFGQKFVLSGERSSDIGGTIKLFGWTLLVP